MQVAGRVLFTIDDAAYVLRRHPTEDGHGGCDRGHTHVQSTDINTARLWPFSFLFSCCTIPPLGAVPHVYTTLAAAYGAEAYRVACASRAQSILRQRTK